MKNQGGLQFPPAESLQRAQSAGSGLGVLYGTERLGQQWHCLGMTAGRLQGSLISLVLP